MTLLLKVIFCFCVLILTISCKKKQDGNNHDELSMCTGMETAGQKCLLRVIDARPTQYAYGRLAAMCKQENYEKMSQSELRDYLVKEKHEVPVVIGPPFSQFYIVDHHHMLTALYNAKLKQPLAERYVIARVKYNFTPSNPDGNEGGAASWENFWTDMQQRNLTWLYDAYGKGPFADPVNENPLPTSVALLKNDPLRSLSYILRESGAYDKKDVFFQEFIWANFLRKFFPFPQPYEELTPEQEMIHMKKVFEDALELSKSDVAAKLPGWNGGRNYDEDTDFKCKMFKPFSALYRLLNGNSK